VLHQHSYFVHSITRYVHLQSGSRPVKMQDVQWW